MKPFYLSIFLILVIFVITSKAHIKNIFTEKKPINGGGTNGYKIWLLPVSGYDKNNSKEGYSGVIGENITSIYIEGTQGYTVHILNEEQWFKKVNGSSIDRRNGYAGYENGKPIDGVAIADNVEYTVHIKDGDWLQPVNGDVNDLNDIAFFEKEKGDNNKDNNKPVKFAGEIGKSIDAIMIKGRTYATSFFSIDKCDAQGGKCILQNGSSHCDGSTYKNHCPDENNYICCMPKPSSKKDNEKKNNLSVIITIIIIVAALITIAVIFYCCHVLFKKWIKKELDPLIDKPPDYTNAVKGSDEIVNISGNEMEPLTTTQISASSSYSTVDTRVNTIDQPKQAQIRIYPNPSSKGKRGKSSTSSTLHKGKKPSKHQPIKLYPNPSLNNTKKS